LGLCRQLSNVSKGAAPRRRRQQQQRRRRMQADHPLAPHALTTQRTPAGFKSMRMMSLVPPALVGVSSGDEDAAPVRVCLPRRRHLDSFWRQGQSKQHTRCSAHIHPQYNHYEEKIKSYGQHRALPGWHQRGRAHRVQQARLLAGLVHAHRGAGLRHGPHRTRFFRNDNRRRAAHGPHHQHRTVLNSRGSSSVVVVVTGQRKLSRSARPLRTA